MLNLKKESPNCSSSPEDMSQSFLMTIVKFLLETFPLEVHHLEKVWGERILQ